MYIQGNPKISIIQGDSFTREISFEGIDFDLIESIYFTSNALSICKKLEKDTQNKSFILHINSSDSINFVEGTFDFDLTIQFVDNQFRTIQYRSNILVLEKVNKVICYE